jgi:hypothetical protein
MTESYDLNRRLVHQQGVVPTGQTQRYIPEEAFVFHPNNNDKPSNFNHSVQAPVVETDILPNMLNYERLIENHFPFDDVRREMSMIDRPISLISKRQYDRIHRANDTQLEYDLISGIAFEAHKQSGYDPELVYKSLKTDARYIMATHTLQSQIDTEKLI